MWSAEDGLPPTAYFEAAYPGLLGARGQARHVGSPRSGPARGRCDPSSPRRLGLGEDVAVAVGNVDSFVSVPGAGVRGAGDLRDGDRHLDLRHGRGDPRGAPARDHRRGPRRHPARPVRLRGGTGRGRGHAGLVRARCSGGEGDAYERLERGAAALGSGTDGVWWRWTGSTATARSSPTPISPGRSSGLTLQSTREQIYRALLESIAFGNRADHGQLHRPRGRADRRSSPAAGSPSAAR